MRASAYQLADESSTLQRALDEREARSLANSSMVKFEVSGDERLTRRCLCRTRRRGTDGIIINDSIIGTVASELPSRTEWSNLPLKQDKAMVDAAAMTIAHAT